MTQQIKFNGTVHNFPDDFTDADIAAALEQEAPPSGHEDMTAKSVAAIEQAKMAGDSPKLVSFAQGGLQNWGDEMIGAIGALRSMKMPGGDPPVLDRKSVV